MEASQYRKASFLRFFSLLNSLSLKKSMKSNKLNNRLLKGSNVMIKTTKILAFLCVLSFSFGCSEDRSSSSAGAPTATGTPSSTLTVGTVTDSGEVNVPILISSITPESSGLQFDIIFDNTKLQFVRLDAGAEAIAAGKTVTTNALPNNNGIRVLLFGVNQNTINNGPVAVAVFNTIGSSGEIAAVSLENVVNSNVSAQAVNTTAESGSITIR
jgi:hypothetical protein